MQNDAVRPVEWSVGVVTVRGRAALQRVGQAREIDVTALRIAHAFNVERFRASSGGLSMGLIVMRQVPAGEGDLRHEPKRGDGERNEASAGGGFRP